ncbi:MAG: hypothetical protein ABJC88_16905 [Parasphingorhabdus sp.]
MENICNWPDGNCACAAEQAEKPDFYGRVWMQCQEGLNMNKASMARFMMFCLANNIEIGSVYAFAPRYKNCSVVAAIRLKEGQFKEFTEATGGKLSKPVTVKLN